MADDPESESRESARDAAWLRWSKFAAIAGVLALVVGGLFGISSHVVALNTFFHNEGIHYTSGKARIIEASEADTKAAFKARFKIGGVIGGAFGLVYVIRCLAKDEDP